MSQILEALFTSTTRVALLRLLFLRKVEDSVSGLARRAGLSPRGVGREVRHLRDAGLLRVEALGGADWVKANAEHPAATHLQGLLSLTVQRSMRPAKTVRGSLVAWGAPLVERPSARPLPLSETLLDALELARADGTLLRVLPVVLAKNLTRLNWPELKEEARRRKVKAELGMLVELTADLLHDDDLRRQVADLHDKRRRVPRFLPEARSRFEQELAKANTPPAAAKWGFLMNMTEDAFRTSLERHLA